jgi:hypothetical protein
MVRICPSCKSHLSRYDRFFCTNCGETLPGNLIDTAGIETKKLEVSAGGVVNIDAGQPAVVSLNAAITTGITNKGIFILLYSTILVAVSFTLYLMFQKALPAPNRALTGDTPRPVVSATSPSVQPESENQTNKYVITPVCTFSEGALFNPDLIKLVPFDTDLFFETPDPQKLIGEFLTSNITADTKFNEFAETNKNNFTGPSGFFIIRRSESYIYGFVTGLNSNINLDVVGKGYNVLSLNGFIVLTTDNSLLAEIKDAGDGISKNLGQNPVYASAKAGLGKEGRLSIIPVTKAGAGYMYQLLDKKLSEEMLSVVNSFLNSKLDYAVVL